MFRMILISLVFASLTAHAEQTFKIIKISGKRAVVEMSDPSSVSVNQDFTVGSSSVSALTGFRRDYALAADVSYVNQTTAPTSSFMTLGGQFLWNFKKYEVGPLFRYSSASSGGFNTSSTAFGAVGFYNFNENKVGVEGVFSAVGYLTQSSGSGSSSTGIDAGVNYRWFVLSGDHCFSFSALYSTNRGSGTTVSSLVFNGGIATYF